MNTILGLDIGTEYVKAALVRDSQVLATARAKQPERTITPRAILDLAKLTTACEEALVAVEDEANTRSGLAVVGIANELVKSTTASVSYSRPNPKAGITEAEMNELLKKVEQKSGEAVKENLNFETGKYTEASLITSAIIAITIDGHKTTDPINHTGEALSATFYTAFAPQNLIKNLEKICTYLSLDLIAIAPRPFALARTALESYPNLTQAIIDLENISSDLAVIENGRLRLARTLPLGARAYEKQPDLLNEAISIAKHEAGLTQMPPVKYYFAKTTNNFRVAHGLALIGADTLASTPKENKLRAKINQILSH